MINRIELKENAKRSLSGKYGDAIGITLLLFAISFIISFALTLLNEMFHFTENTFSTLTSISSLVISGLFTLGYTSFFLKISRDEKVEINELWSKTHLFIPYIVASLLVGLFTTLWTLLLIIPGIIATFSYSMIYYIMLDHPEYSASKIIRESKRIMRGHKMDLFILSLSFLGWMILGLFTLGILYIWLIPYMNVTICNFYNVIKDTN